MSRGDRDDSIRSAKIIDATVVVTGRGAAGRITLNRPKAINALTLEMVHAIDAALDRFAADDAVSCVVLDGAGDRGFCAGGDIVTFHTAATTGDHELALAFWRAEYRLNARISHYPKPVVAIMDGIVMGGGIGLAGHASHRVVTERSIVAMPEVGIGFVPDVGGTWLLGRAPGQLGLHLALTTDRARGADAIVAGLADVLVPSERLEQLVAALGDGDVASAIAEHAQPAGRDGGAGSTGQDDGAGSVGRRDGAGGADDSAGLSAARDWIDACYGADSVEAIVAALADRPETEARTAAQAISAQSPTSVTVTLAAIRRARELDSLEACLEQEYRTSHACLSSADMVEGIRAAVIDKDRTPHWDPPTLADVSATTVAQFFAPLTEAPELSFADE